MKVKILIFPLFIVGILWLIIWVIVPKYNEMNVKSKDLAVVETKLADLRDKNAKVDSLAQYVAANPDELDVVMKYLPDKSKEEELLVTLIDSAQKEGVLLSSLKIPKGFEPAQEVLAGESANGVMDPGIYPGKNPAVQGGPAPEALQKINQVKVSNMPATLEVVGSYEKIKSFLLRLSKLKRFNDVTSVGISKGEAEDKEAAGDNSANNLLKVSIALTFNYLAKGNSGESYPDVSFSNMGDQFQYLETIDQIKLKTAEIIGVTVDNAGRANPFIP